MRSFVWTSTLVCLLTVACGYIASPVLATSGDEKKVQPRIQWGDDVLAGYRQSIKQKKPLVIVFVCPMEQEMCVHCKRFRKSLASKRLDQFARQAIFVLSEIDVRNNKRSNDDTAKVVFDRLEYKSTPAMTVLEPNPDVLAELGSMRGYFNDEKVEKYLGKILNEWYENPTLTAVSSDDSNND